MTKFPSQLIVLSFVQLTLCVLSVQAVQMMKEAGLRPDTYCMNSVMAVNVQARQPNAALKIFEEMKRDDIPRDVVREREGKRAIFTLTLLRLRPQRSITFFFPAFPESDLFSLEVLFRMVSKYPPYLTRNCCAACFFFFCGALCTVRFVCISVSPNNVLYAF